MAGRIPQEFINGLLDRIDIAEVVGARLELKKAGREYKALCPFHGEKTPSFHVVPDKGFYHCFGCGQHGTALTFLLEHDRMQFIEAVEALAAMAGVEVPSDASAARRDDGRVRLFEAVERADRWFRQQLRSHPDRQRAVDYLRRRGVDGEVARTFGIGYAPEGYRNLLPALGGDATTKQLLVESGLLAVGDEQREPYDRFRDRITFPIRDGRGRTIAFGGRVLGDGKPKYLNSPETPLFHKGHEVYGLWEARRAVRNPERVLLVEGYMDVIGLVQAGIPEACASLGTAATRDQLQKLFRFAPEVVLCFDGDEAGRRAAWKAVGTALEVLEDGVSVRLLFLPEGEDPDTLVRAEGAAAFRERIRTAGPLSEYLFDALAVDLDTDVLDGRSRLAHRAMPLLNRIAGPVLRTLMIGRLAELTEMPVDALTRMLDASAAVMRESAAAREAAAASSSLDSRAARGSITDSRTPDSRTSDSRTSDSRTPDGRIPEPSSRPQGAAVEAGVPVFGVPDPSAPDLSAYDDAPEPVDRSQPPDGYEADGVFGRSDSDDPARSAVRPPPRAVNRGRVRRSKEDMAAALLLRQPELARRVSAAQLQRLTLLERDSVGALCVLIERLHTEPTLAPAALIGEQTGTPLHAHLVALLQLEVLPDPERMSSEFDEALERLQAEAVDARRRALMERIRAGSASRAELAEFMALKRIAAGVPERSEAAGAVTPPAADAIRHDRSSAS